MKNCGERIKPLSRGYTLLALFVIWTALIQIVDVEPIGPRGTEVGFAAFNGWFHNLTGTNMTVYEITDWLGLVPIFVCAVFGFIGAAQVIKRRSLLKVDRDMIFLGIYYVTVIFGFLIFEMIPVNYRPVLIEGALEASYPSSTTLLVLSVMPTLVFQCSRRVKNMAFRKGITAGTYGFSVFMVLGRLTCGVHWFTDIVGGILLSSGLFCMYKATVLKYCQGK